MAGQNILQFGLDVSAFDEQKKAKLQEFIGLFDQLAKYDGAKFSPVLGGGLSDFNSSLTQTNALLAELNANILRINATKVTVKAPVQDIKEFGNEVENTSNKSSSFFRILGSGNGNIATFGRELTRGLTVLRQIAYILPGIGIAGIFNLGFEAIASAAQELDLFTASIKKEIDYQNELNKSIEETTELNEKLYATNNKLNEQNNARLTPQDEFSNEVARGYDQVKLAKDKADLAERDLGKSTADIVARGNAPEALQTDLNRRIGILDDYSKRLAIIDKAITEKDNPAKVDKSQGDIVFRGAPTIEGVYNPKKETLQDLKKGLEEKIKIGQDSYNIDKGLLDKYITSQQDYFKTKAELEKINSDQARKLLVDTSKDNISVKEEEYKKIQNLDVSRQNEILKAIEDEYQARLRANNIARINVTGVLQKDVTPTTHLNPNLSATHDDIKIAFNKQYDDNQKDLDKRNTQIRATNEEFYQRAIKAERDYNNSILEADSINQKAIYDNQNKSLNERLLGLQNYINDKKKIQQNEYDVDIQKGASFKGDRTSLTGSELNALNEGKFTQDSNIQAETEEKAYNITKQFLDKRLKDVIEENNTEETANTKAYADALNKETALYDAKTIKYSEYRKKIEEIRRKYSVDDDKQNIAKDTDNVNRLNNLVEEDQKTASNATNSVEEKTKKRDEAKSTFDLSPTDDNRNALLQSQQQLDESVGLSKAADDAILKSKEELNKAVTQLDKDRLKEAIDNIAKEDRAKQEQKNLFKKIGDQLFDLLKVEVDKGYEYREVALERNKETIDESYDGEIKAIQDSSLSKKDAAALDIQLSEQKREYDKAATIEERKLKHDNAVADRDIAVAKTIWNTEQAISKTYAELGPVLGTPLAIEQGVLGALEVATIEATAIPSYAKGIKSTPDGRISRFGESGAEKIIEPNKAPYWAFSETISYLPKGTEIIPIKDNIDFEPKKVDTSWEQTRFLARQIKRLANPQPKVITNVYIDSQRQNYKKKILGN